MKRPTLYILAALLLGLVVGKALGVDVPSGGNVGNALRAGGDVRLSRGGTYRGSLSIGKDGTSLGSYGDSSRPAPVVRGGLRMDGRRNVRIIGIKFDGAGISTNGIDVFNSRDVELTGCQVVGFGGMGITAQGYGGKRCSNVTIRGCLIADNWPATGKHVSGLFASYTDGLWLAESVFDTNGWKPGIKNATIYNHGSYIHATCGPATVSDCVFRDNASHGLQQRSGGPSFRNLFIDNAIHQSYGLVNGAPCFPGGVSGEIKGSVFLGGRDIAGSKRGWCLELSNIKKVVASDLLMAHDNQNNNVAITVQKSERVENPRELVGVRDLNLRDIYVWDWPRGAIRVSIDPENVRQSRVGAKPPMQADLRKALGTDFMARARRDPSNAARIGIAACRTAAGIDSALPPVELPPTDPSIELRARLAEIDRLLTAMTAQRTVLEAERGGLIMEISE